jgi:hypothetical protein
MKETVLLVCGGRDFNDAERVFAVLDGIMRQLSLVGSIVRQLVTGDAAGADALAVRWATERRVSFRVYVAEWEKHGRKAGPLRNQRMLDENAVGMVVAFPGGRGTDDMVRRADAARIEVRRVPPKSSTVQGCYPWGLRKRGV